MTDMPSTSPGSRPDAAARFRERLWPGPLGWALVVGFAAFVLVAVLPVRPIAAVAASVVALLAGIVVAVRTSAVVEVGAGRFTAGRATIDVRQLGEARRLDREEVRQALGPGSDARTYACLRAWLPGAVEVAVTDPADPTPAWLVSTRRPAELLAALGAERQAAHSEQIG